MPDTDAPPTLTDGSDGTQRGPCTGADRAAFGRDDIEPTIGALVRVNVARADVPQAIADDISRVADTLGFEHFFIEQMYTDDTVEQAITSAIAFLDLIGPRTDNGMPEDLSARTAGRT